MKRRSKKVQLSKDEYPEWLDHSVWADFIQFRKEIGKPIFSIGERRILKKLEQLGIENYQEILDRSIRNNWQDVYQLPNEFKSNESENHQVTTTFNPADHL